MEQLITLLILALVGLAKFLEFYNKQKRQDTPAPKRHPGVPVPQHREPVLPSQEEYESYTKPEEPRPVRPEQSEYRASQEDIERFLQDIGILKPKPQPPVARPKIEHEHPRKIARKRKHHVDPESLPQQTITSPVAPVSISEQNPILHAVEPSEPEENFYEMLFYDPDSLRTAFVMNEIFQQPKSLRKKRV
ncbi:MAG: hypothetical protein AB1454_00125 [Candidatus Auribacterota bacterium]